MSPLAVIVDTDVFSYVAWRRPEANAFTSILRDRLLSVSFATAGELYFGAAKARWGEKRVRQLTMILKGYILLPGTYDVASAYGDIKAAFRDQVDEGDMWTAATAIAYQMPLVTNNLRHFEPMSDRFDFNLLYPERL